MRNFLTILFFLVILVSCQDNRVYDHYDHTPLSGWDRVDDLTFDVPALKDSGRYVTTLGLRINGDYPFLSMTMIVEQHIYNKSHNKYRQTKVVTDTVNCNLFDDNGRVKGSGISYYQYHYRISELPLNIGDSLHISVRHDMRREIMPGISDVGISMTKQ